MVKLLPALLFVDMIFETSFPPGAYNLINGRSSVAGAALAGDKVVEMVSFTGSNQGGVAFVKPAAPSIKRMTLELGGKSPTLLFTDTGLATAVDWNVDTCFSNVRQTCDAPIWLLVERTIYEPAKDINSQTALATKARDPAVPRDPIGSVINARQFDSIQHLILGGID